MQFKYLSAALHPTAAEVVKHFRDNFGLTGFRPEEAIHPEIGFTPTLHAVNKTHHIVCVEISEQVYPASLDAFVLSAKNLSLPILLYVAVPTGLPQSEFNAAFKRAKENGVGILEVGPKSAKMLSAPLSLSLTGVRPIPVSKFPAKYRQSLSTAQQTFLNGDPAKGCANVYDEIEALCRRIVKRADAKALWKDPLQVPTKLKRDTGPWTKIVEMLQEHMDAKKMNCPDLDDGLLYRILGITPHRHEVGHKPSVAALKKRDSELRTRFEHATDILHDLVRAAGSLRV
jgi:hypothetical protein